MDIIPILCFRHPSFISDKYRMIEIRQVIRKQLKSSSLIRVPLVVQSNEKKNVYSSDED